MLTEYPDNARELAHLLKVIADETGSNQLSNHGLIQLNDGRILLGISHYRNVQPMTSDLDLAIFDERWLLDG